MPPLLPTLNYSSLPPSPPQDLGLLLAIFTAVVHDYEHKGVNNDFLVKTSDPLAVRRGV